MPCLWVHKFFILLDQVCFWYFLSHFSFHSLYSSAPEFLFGSFFMISFSVLNLLFCSCTVSLILLNCLSVFSFGSWASLRQLFWILYQANCRSPFLWNQLLENYCAHLVVSCFLDCFCVLKVLHCCIHIWRSSHILNSLLTGFEREISLQHC